jgi:hypothetical protein
MEQLADKKQFDVLDTIRSAFHTWFSLLKHYHDDEEDFPKQASY